MLTGAVPAKWWPCPERACRRIRGKGYYKVNTDQEPEISGAFGIQSIPSILFIPVGEKPQMAAGALPKQTFKNIIKDVLKVN